ncbi:MAG: Rho termination factor [Spirulinaceae cyanobacterium]
MSNLSSVGNLMYLDRSEIDPGEGTSEPEFLIQATAKKLNETGGRNWLPVIVKETGEDEYEVIGNFFGYAVAEAAGLEKVWCIIAEPDAETTEITQLLTQERLPQINICNASYDEIKAALQYLLEQPGTPLKGVKLAVAANRIDEAPRQYWQSLQPITKLGCGITRGKKLDTLKAVFYTNPIPLPDVIKDPILLDSFNKTQLQEMAKKRGFSGYSKKSKADLIKLLSV